MAQCGKMNGPPPPYSPTAPFMPTDRPGCAPVIITPPAPPPASTYGSVTVVNVPPIRDVVMAGGCPACRIGVVETHYTCGGILCAIFCFPLGYLCCLASRYRRCSHCYAIFG